MDPYATPEDAELVAGTSRTVEQLRADRRAEDTAGEVSDDLLARVISVLKAGIRYAGPADGAGVRHLTRLVEELERVQAAR